jgi:hypothetical protein
MADPASADPDVDVAHTSSRRDLVPFTSRRPPARRPPLAGPSYRILVFRLPERVAVADDCCTEVLDLARLRADRLVQETFVHDCDSSGLRAWVQYSEA